MRALTSAVLAVAACSLLACSESDPPPDDSADTGGAAGSSGSSSSGMGGTSGSGGSSRGGSSTGGSGPEGGAPSADVFPMPIISRGAPTFASGYAHDGGLPEFSNDGVPNTTWLPDGLPCWIAYDLSSVPSERRQEVLVAWFAPRSGGYVGAPLDRDVAPLDYTIEINSGSGGGSPPADGWNVVTTVTDNDRNARQHLFDLEGANWVRMSVTRGSAANAVNIDLDVYSAPDGASDAWLFMGDSITYMTMQYSFSNLPTLVNEAAGADRWPIAINAALGGTNTGSAGLVIEETMARFEGKFVILAYGTNNHIADFSMEDLVLKVIAANKVPVVPHMPWSETDGIQTDGPLINAAIDALYEQYPEIVPGPDLWAVFENRLDLIPPGDVHPTTEGQEHLRQTWANWMVDVAE